MNEVLGNYFSPGPELLFSFIEQEYVKDNTSHLVSIQTAVHCCLMGSSAGLVTFPAAVISQNTASEHLKSLRFFLKYLGLNLNPNIEGFFLQN